MKSKKKKPTSIVTILLIILIIVILAVLGIIVYKNQNKTKEKPKNESIITNSEVPKITEGQPISLEEATKFIKSTYGEDLNFTSEDETKYYFKKPNSEIIYYVEKNQLISGITSGGAPINDND